MTHIHRFFLDQKVSSGRQVRIEDEDVFHAARVLRLKSGDAVEISDREGEVYAARVRSLAGGVEVAVGELIQQAPQAEGLTVVQALPRGRKMDLVVEKLSELGIDRLVPVWTDKSVAPPDPEGEKVRRWRRLARAAAAQAKRSRVMAVDEPMALPELIAVEERPLVVLIAESEAEPLGNVLARVEGPPVLVIGPESGFSGSELGQLESAGAIPGRLGGLVLRTETAALVAATIVLHHMGKI